jgi:hypothetical protein
MHPVGTDLSPSLPYSEDNSPALSGTHSQAEQMRRQEVKTRILKLVHEFYSQHESAQYLINAQTPELRQLRRELYQAIDDGIIAAGDLPFEFVQMRVVNWSTVTMEEIGPAIEQIGRAIGIAGSELMESFAAVARAIFEDEKFESLLEYLQSFSDAVMDNPDFAEFRGTMRSRSEQTFKGLIRDEVSRTRAFRNHYVPQAVRSPGIGHRR